MFSAVELLNRLVTFLIAGTSAFKAAQLTIDHLSDVAARLWDEVKDSSVLLKTINEQNRELRAELVRQSARVADLEDELARLKDAA